MHDIVDKARALGKNILILAAPRSGSHAVASMFRPLAPDAEYLGEICRIQDHEEPWRDIDQMLHHDHFKISHVVQAIAKIFLSARLSEIKQHCLIVELRRRDKLQQFASWIYFRQIGAIYNFDHLGEHYLPPGSIEITMRDIENFLVEQMLDLAFMPDRRLYYEDLDFSTSTVMKKLYAYPISTVIKNFDLAEKYLATWQYHD